MHVFFDHQCYWEKYGGVSRYFTEILKTSVPNVNYELAIKYSNNEYIKELGLQVMPLLDDWNIPKKKYLISAFNKPNTISCLKQTKANIVHLTHYDPYLFKYTKNKIVVSTMHDLNYFAIPQFYKRRTELLKNWQIKCAQMSDKIIVISENTKKDLVNYLNIKEENIAVIHHGVSKTFTKTTCNRIIDKPYILFVGARLAYKNFDTLLHSFANIRDKYKDLVLVCTGSPLSPDEKKKIANIELTGRIIQLSVSESDLVNLYSNALMFVFPSFYEGFGLPILEAMSCECPVICSNTSCFPEIAQTAALYFNPHSSDELTDIINETLMSKQLRDNLVAKGLDRIKSFSWDLSREKHLNFYKSIDEK